MTIFRTINKEIFIENATLDDYVTGLNTVKSIHQRIENSHTNAEYSSVVCGYLFSKHKTPIELYSKYDIKNSKNIINDLINNGNELIINDGLQRKCDIKRFIEGETVTVPQIYWNIFDEKIKSKTGFTTTFLHNYLNNKSNNINNRKFTYHDLLPDIIEEFKNAPIRINITISNFKDDTVLQNNEISRLIEELNTHAQFPKNQSCINSMSNDHIKNTINNLKEHKWINDFEIVKGKRRLLSGKVNGQLQIIINYYIFNALSEFLKTARVQNSYLTKDYFYMPKKITSSNTDQYLTQIFATGISDLGFNKDSSRQLFDNITDKISKSFEFFLKNNIHSNDFENYMVNNNYILLNKSKMRDINDGQFDIDNNVYKEYNLNKENICSIYCMYITSRFGNEINTYNDFIELTNKVIEKLNIIANTIFYHEKTIDLLNQSTYNININNMTSICTLYEIFDNALNDNEYSIV